MIGSSEEKRKNRLNELWRVQHIFEGESSGSPYEIAVPVITRKERYLMDSAMPCVGRMATRGVCNPVNTHLCVYPEIYRFLPAYAERSL